MKAKNYIADFDSAAAMTRGVARFLDGKAMPVMGMMPKPLSLAVSPFAKAVNMAPKKMREQIYTWSGWNEAIQARKLRKVRSDAMRQWAVNQYPKRRYPCLFIGSSGGALVHLACALGAPWLPQTFLVPVRRHGVHPDEPRQDVSWGLENAPKLLDHNNDIQLHHMHDPNQDRLMVQHMTYFRIKLREIGNPYEEFIHQVLDPGATIYVVDCKKKWPTTKLGERYYFQHGAVGGATIEEFHHGSPRVEKYLKRYDSHRRRWDAPEPDGERPEAEWGFESAMLDDLERFAYEGGYRLCRISYDEPQDLSPMVADLYRWWYEQRNMVANRLVAESFVLTDPWWTLRTGSVPFWMVFNKEPSAEALEAYLDERPTFDEIGLTLFSHGVDSVGLVPIERWRAILDRARDRGFFIGVNEKRFPRDFSVLVDFNRRFPKEIKARYPMPGPLHLSQFSEFMDTYGDQYDVDIDPDYGVQRFGTHSPTTRR
jgi:hypothetical protein